MAGATLAGANVGSDHPFLYVYLHYQLGPFTLKTPGSEIDSERVHWGQTPFQVNAHPEISQLDTECDPELGQSDPIICQVCRKLTNFRVIFNPEWSLAPMDPFPGHADPGVLKCFLISFHGTQIEAVEMYHFEFSIPCWLYVATNSAADQVWAIKPFKLHRFLILYLVRSSKTVCI